MMYIGLGGPALRILIEEKKEQEYNILMKDYQNNKYEVDQLQKLWKCCGTASYMYKVGSIPQSCCKDSGCTSLFTKHCETAFADKYVTLFQALIPLGFIDEAMFIALVVLVYLIHKRQGDD
ncbi:Hypothetical protein NTJ_13933 [Nesidiocoris tenuis]|nr:Hypothetical protein NTJ_13933 [Nesidiocoris tenuis]